MIQTSFENKVQIQDILNNQIPEFVVSESPKFLEFLKQYYISQESQGGNIDIVENLPYYLKLDNFTPEILNNTTNLTQNVSTDVENGITSQIFVSSTKGFPKEYGLIQINDEIITYKSKTSTSFNDCVRNFSGIDKYGKNLTFKSTNISSHKSGDEVLNLSVLFLHEFYKKIKNSLLVELESKDLDANLNINNFLKSTTSLYQTKGNRESIRILFNALFGVDPKVIDLEEYVIKSSHSDFMRRREVLVELLTANGNPGNIRGQQITKTNDENIFASVSEVESIVRFGKKFYKLFLYIGYDEITIGNEDKLGVTPSTKLVENIKSSDNSNVLTVDSTIGFGDSGILYYNQNKIFYTEKSVNQFFGCYTENDTYINLDIPKASNIHSDDTYYSYENGDITKKIEFRVLGSANKLILNYTNETINYVSDIGDNVNVSSLGKNFKKGENKIADSLIYNTSVRIPIRITNFKGSDAQIDTTINSNVLKVGDTVEFLRRNTEIPSSEFNTAIVNEITESTISFNRSFGDVNQNSNSLNLESIDVHSGTLVGTARTILLSDTTGIDIGDLVTFDSDNNTLTEDLGASVVAISQNGNGGIVTISKESLNTTTINGNFTFKRKINYEYDIRRKLEYANSSVVELKYDKLFPNIINFYDEEDTNFYIASNSLPSYLINSDIAVYSASGIEDSTFDPIQDSYTEIKMSSKNGTLPPFLDGQKVYYSYTGDEGIGGLEEGVYYVTTRRKDSEFFIKLYYTISSLQSDDQIYFKSKDIPTGVHNFTLYNQKTDENKIFPAKILKKITYPTEYNENNQDVNFGTVGILVNGVEILSPKSNDKIYYGPLKSVDVLNGGFGYDVINPPKLSVDGNAKLQPVLTGSVEKVHVDPFNFEVEEPISITITGGNGKNAVLSPQINLFSREVFFNAKLLSDNGGIDNDLDTLTFITDHNFLDGEKIIYDKNNPNNPSIGLSTFKGFNRATSYLANNSSYYVEVVNSKTVRLYPDLDSYTSGINTVGFSTEGLFGLHKFKTLPVKTISSINVENPGEGYSNRKLIVKQSGISTVNDLITFKNHGFSDGELVTYNYQTTSISGLSSDKQYYILTNDKNSFRLCDAGIGGTDVTLFNRKKYVSIASSGTGYQYFNYPDIKVNVEYTISGTTGLNTINCTPVVKGSIDQIYLYEEGVDYGSSILNLEVSPNISVIQGKEASLKPIITDGKITNVIVTYGGYDYNSVPEIKIISSKGIGAVVRVSISNGKIVSAKVINQGSGYSYNDIKIEPIFTGQGLVSKCRVRDLTVDSAYSYGTEYSDYRDPANEILYKNSQNKLQYVVNSYSQKLINYFSDSGLQHSPIIGWAYDGNPIYGPYGYSNPEKSGSVQELSSGYVKDISNVINRPTDNKFSVNNDSNSSFFIEDYKFNNSGDLDEYNGRWCVTPEYPNGVYAYFATIRENKGNKVGRFPYFIGPKYKSKLIEENINKILDQSLDFNNTSLKRNTSPYKTNDEFASYDFFPINLSNEKQTSKVSKISSGIVTSVEIINAGKDYNVGDTINIEDESKSKSTVRVTSLEGKKVTSIVNTTKKYENVKIYSVGNSGSILYILPSHDIKNNTKVDITGVSTNFANLEGNKTVSVDRFGSRILNEVPEFDDLEASGRYHSAVSGIVTDIQVENLPNIVSIGSSVKITHNSNSGNTDHYFSVLNVFRNENVLRVKKTNVVGFISEYSNVSFLPHYIKLDDILNDGIKLPKYKRYFNPLESVGVGDTVGISTEIKFSVGTNQFTRNIPTQSIYLPNHNLITGQKVTISRPNASSDNFSLTEFERDFSLFPTAGLSTEVYIIKKTEDLIGITTNVGFVTSSSGAFFTNKMTAGNNFEYSIEPIVDEETCVVKQNTAKVSVSTDHYLKNNDVIDLQVKPNLSVGIGTTEYVKFIKHDEGFIGIHPTYIESISGGSGYPLQLTITGHPFKTGDRVRYNSVESTPLEYLDGSSYLEFTSKQFYVYRVDENNINLALTHLDSTSKPPILIRYYQNSLGSLDYLTLINKSIDVTSNNNLVLNLSDSSIQGYKLKLYYDKNLQNEFISGAGSSTFNFTNVGFTTYTLESRDNNPSVLYYSLVDSTNKNINTIPLSENNAKIVFVDSKYNSKYRVTGVGDTTFEIYLNELPERSSYTQEECDTLKYTTTSKNAKGSVNKIQILDQQKRYYSKPYLTSIGSTSGVGLDIELLSKDIGRILEKEDTNSGFEYSIDNTIRPTLSFPQNITVTNNNILSNINVINRGKGYPSAPNLVLVNTETGEKINHGGLIVADLGGASGNISNVNILITPSGLPKTKVTVKSIDNSNGIRIDKIVTESDNSLTCNLATPILGFSTDPFKSGDKVFLENIDIVPNSGIGFNSEVHGYEFYEVISYTSGSNPGTVVFRLPATKSKGSPGIAITFQTDTFATAIREDAYPTFEVIQEPGVMKIGERVILDNKDGTYFETDLTVVRSTSNKVKLLGNYVLNKDDVIIGKETNIKSTIYETLSLDGEYTISGSVVKEMGWSSESGKLNSDVQFISDNDYYQNMAYTIKSPKLWSEIESSVNSIIHPLGTKNFSDTQITGITTNISGSKTALDSIVTRSQSFISQSRSDIIKNFDFVKDFDVINNRSQSLLFKNVELTDSFIAKTNRVLKIDNISGLFSSSDDEYQDDSLVIDSLSARKNYYKFLIQIKSSPISILNGYNHLQFVEMIVLYDGINFISYLDKSSYSNKDLNEWVSSDIVPSHYGYVEPIANNNGNIDLYFYPNDVFDVDYDVKLLKTNYESYNVNSGSFDVGPISIFAKNTNTTSSNIVNVEELDSVTYTAFLTEAHVYDRVKNIASYHEIVTLYDGNDVQTSQFEFNSNKQQNSDESVGIFTSNLSGGNIILQFEPNETSNISVRTKTYGFGDTSIGISTYYFKSNLQDNESVRTIKIVGDHTNTGTSSASKTLISFNKNLFSSVKTYARVSLGSTISLHQIVTLCDIENSYTTEGPLVSIGNSVGYFESDINGDNLELKFKKSSEYSGSDVSITHLNYAFYSFLDESNVPNQLSVENLQENQIVSKYFSINSDNRDRTNFKLKYNGIPIYAKTFNPYDDNILTPSTGTFNISNHFFSTGERLIYTPNATFVGYGISAMHTSSNVGLSTEVYAIKVNNNSFQLAESEENAYNGIAITFDSYLGEGNAHQLEMYKKNEKTLIMVNDIVQYPLLDTNLNFQLTGHNQGNIGIADTFFALSGISSIRLEDILKIDDEYMKVVNVGIGTSSYGPIQFTSGDLNIVEVKRGFVGSAASEHTDGTNVDVYRGSYNIVGDEIHFVNSPRGNIGDLNTRDESNLLRARAEFSGRTFLRKNYSTNEIFDDFSNEFDGINTTFELTQSGLSTVGFGTTSGNGFLFINGIFQVPDTQNSTNSNFRIVSTSNKTNVVFTGIRDEDNLPLELSEDDVNQNQLPRGGLIVSLGSSSGMGYAPLVPAVVRLDTNESGEIIDVVSIASTAPNQTIGIVTAKYDNIRGILEIVSTEDDVTNNIVNRNINFLKLVGLGFTCDSSSDPTTVVYFPSDENPKNIIGLGKSTVTVNVGVSTLRHNYVGYGTVFSWYQNLTVGSGYTSGPIVGIVSDIGSGTLGSGAEIGITVGAGGTLGFNIDQPGSGYVTPVLNLPQPSYSNLPVTGISRLGIGTTTDTGVNLLVDLEVGPAAIGTDGYSGGNIGIGSTLFGIKSFSIARQGYGFKRGDVITAVGLVTAKELTEPLEEFKLFVLDTYQDSVASWQLGEMNLIDSIKSYQNGIRSAFPLFYEGELLSFQKDKNDVDSSFIDFNSLLVVFINGILQEPELSYDFNGGAVVTFLEPPKKEDEIEIYFYVGSRGEDSFQTDIIETIQVGDTLQVKRFDNTDIEQKQRTVFSINSVDTLNTDLYAGEGIDQEKNRPVNWIKQKQDFFINGVVYSKSRDSIEGQVYPIAKVISDFDDNATEIYVDNIELFDYEEKLIDLKTIDCFIIPDQSKNKIAIATANVSSIGTISSFNIDESGFGYSSTPVIKISNPIIGIGENRLWGTVGIGSTPSYSVSRVGTVGVDTTHIIVSDISNIVSGAAVTSIVTKDFDGVNGTGNDIRSIVSEGTTVQHVSSSGIVTITKPIIGITTTVTTTFKFGDLSVGDVGIGSTATATVTIENGSVSDITVVRPGSGYTDTSIPQVVISSPDTEFEEISKVTTVVGLSGAVVGIGTTDGINGADLALSFTLKTSEADYSSISQGIPIYIFNTTIGTGVTSIDTNNNDTIGISTQFLDNVYKVQFVDIDGSDSTGIITCNIASDTDISGQVGIGTTGTLENPVGRFSWGKISGFSRAASGKVSMAVTSYTVSGLSSYPTIRRSGTTSGLRNTGALTKKST